MFGSRWAPTEPGSRTNSSPGTSLPLPRSAQINTPTPASFDFLNQSYKMTTSTRTTMTWTPLPDLRQCQVASPTRQNPIDGANSRQRQIQPTLPTDLRKSPDKIIGASPGVSAPVHVGQDNTVVSAYGRRDEKVVLLPDVAELVAAEPTPAAMVVANPVADEGQQNSNRCRRVYRKDLCANIVSQVLGSLVRLMVMVIGLCKMILRPQSTL